MVNDNIEKDKVSVIIPIYNDEKYLRHCVDSVLKQSYCNLEIVLVDDASTDDSLSLCRSYEANDSRVKVVHNDKNCGLSGSREKGYLHASGEWICFLDHDDCMNSRAIEWMISYADAQTDIVAGKYKNIINKDFEQYVWKDNDRTEAITLEHDGAVDTLGSFSRYEVPECLWGKIYRRNLFERIDFMRYKEAFPMVYFEDVLLTSALIDACRSMKIVNQYGYIHRVDANSVSMSPYALEFNLETARSADIVLGRLDKAYAKNAYARVMQNYLLVFSKNWYLVNRYHNKKPELLREMEELFERYYEIYCHLKIKLSGLSDLCIRIFKGNKLIFSLVICRLWFEWISKIRYRLQSK